MKEPRHNLSKVHLNGIISIIELNFLAMDFIFSRFLSLEADFLFNGK